MALALAVVGLAVGAALVAHELDSPAFGVQPAPEADAPACARIAKDYPSGLSGQRRATVSLPGVAVWGDGAVTLRCGLHPPEATVEACINVDDVDWVWRDATSRGGSKVLVTYGRDPAVEVRISDRVGAIDEVLVGLSRAVKPIVQKSKCIGDEDVPAL